MCRKTRACATVRDESAALANLLEPCLIANAMACVIDIREHQRELTDSNTSKLLPVLKSPRSAPGIIWLVCADGHNHHGHRVEDGLVAAVDAAVHEECPRGGVPEQVVLREPGHDVQVFCSCTATR